MKTRRLTTSPAPSDIQIKPPGKLALPMAMRVMTPMRSVTRSATTMGAVRAMGMPRVSNRMSDLKTSPTLPGVIVSTKPERNVRKLSPFGIPRIPSTAR